MDEPYKTCYFCGGTMKQITVGNSRTTGLKASFTVIKRVPAAYARSAERNTSLPTWATSSTN